MKTTSHAWLIAAAAALTLTTAHTHASTTLPSDISDLFVWLDAGNVDGSNNATLTDGQLLSTVNNGANAQDDWFDGGSQTLGDWQAPGGTRDPRLVENAINGQSVVRFDGGDDLVLSLGAARPSMLNSVSDDATIFVVSDHRGGVNGALISTRGGAGAGWTFRSVDDDTYRYFFTGRNADLETHTIGSGFHMAQLDRDGDNPAGQATLTLDVDGTFTSTDTGTNGFLTSPNGTAIGRNRAGSGGYTGDIAELIIYDRLLTAGEAAAVGRYLGAKYSLTQSISLNIDFGATGGSIGTQSGFRPFEEATGQPAGTTTKTYDSYLGADGTVDVSVFTTSTVAGTTQVAFRDRGSITGDFASQSNLLGDMIFARIDSGDGLGNETLHLQLDDLAAGRYQITLYHHDRNFADGDVDVLLTDADGVDQLIAAAVSQSTGAAPTAIATTTLAFTANGTDAVVISLREINGTASNETAVLSGFELTLIPSPAALPAGLALIGLLAARRRRNA